MKKELLRANVLAILVGLIFTFISCDDSVTISKSEYDKLKGVKAKVTRAVTFPESSNADAYIWEIIQCSDGHDYMENHAMKSYVLMHYIECNKCKKK